MPRFLCVIATEDRLWNTKRALRNLQGEGGITGVCFSVYTLAMQEAVYEEMLREAQSCDFAIVYFHGGAQLLPDFKGFWKRISARMPIFFQSSLPEEIAELVPSSGLDVGDYQSIMRYFIHADEPNLQGMFRFIASNYLGVAIKCTPPVPPVREGIYLGGRVLDADEQAAYLQKAAMGEKPVVGLILHQNNILNGNARHIDAMIERLETLGALPLAMFTRMAKDEDDKHGVAQAMDRFFRHEGKALPECIIVMTGFSLTLMGMPGDGSEREFISIFEAWDVPVLQAPATYQSAADYDEKPQGIDSMSLSTSIFQPELDGQVLTVACATQETIVSDGVERRITVPITDRVDRIARTAIGWAKLGRKKNKDKKIAILFHCMPGNDKIGCAEGLDTFESVNDVVKALDGAGCRVDYAFENGQEIIKRITDGLTNDENWLSRERMAELAHARVPRERYEAWCDSLDKRSREQLERVWGKLPGEVMQHEGEILIPGFQNGHVFIGLQPSRAFGEQASALYHSTEFPPPYSYIAYYRWLEEDFGADVIIHVGTHGSLEWLPGKEVGLSSRCYPDICLGSVPHLYIYHIGITGEGIQAKRRSSAVILDHLPPSMREAGTYEKLSDLDEAFKQYNHARQARPVQMPELAQRIFDIAQDAALLTELGIDAAARAADEAACLDKLHLWVGELKHAAMRDGLHIFGRVPEGELFDNLARTLLRVPNGTVPALNDAVLAAMGYNADAVRDDQTAFFGAKTGMELYEEAIAAAKGFVQVLSACGYDENAVPGLIRAARAEYPGELAPLEEALLFLCDTVKPRLELTKNEMTNIVRGVAARFVPPGPGGNPTRGNVDILPTGRNFTAGDPTQIPSRVAWSVGQQLAKKVLEHHLKEEGDYPESIAMVVWAGGVLKTCGEDFAQILYLMGARPIYLGQTTKVIGVEAIPMDDLGRPRIDVTLRISGLLRDMYPNLIRLMDDAVACVAALDEDDEVNFIKKHMRADIAAMVAEGVCEQEANEQASVRVFGCAPGTYGAGVAHVIESRQWSDFEDLATVYENHSSHGYGKTMHGKRLESVFCRRLSTVTMTIKNESSVETDMLDSDDFYAYHGGLIAAVRKNSGRAPISLTGHTDDPDRPVVRDVALETARIMRTKILNPAWLEGVKRHGFKGAQEISAAMDSYFGWDATAETGRDWMYEAMAERFLFDAATRRWMEEVNRFAVHALSERLLEAEKRGMWNAKPETLEKVQEIYMRAEGLIEEGLK